MKIRNTVLPISQITNGVPAIKLSDIFQIGDVIQAIDGNSDFEIRYAVLSGFSSVLSAFSIDQTVQTLIQVLRENPDSQIAVLERLKSLIPDYQKDYMHSHDIPVCAYLYALHQVENTAMLETVIPAIASKKEFFWARKMAAKILSESEQESAH